MSKTVRARKRNIDAEPRYVVGMDAHSQTLAISIWDWSDRFNPVLLREFKSVNIEAMGKTYQRHVDLDSITIIESSTNTAWLKRTLVELGFRAEVVRADIIANKERKRKVCDIQDARNLAMAYIKGDVDEFVWTPSEKYSELRDIVFSYRDASKEIIRSANRIWSFCCQKGVQLPIRSGQTHPEDIREMVSELPVTGFSKERLEMLIADYEHYMVMRDKLKKLMAKEVLQSEKMLKLMQLPGVNYRGAFALEAATEDARRFASAAKFKAYCGFAPITNSSGLEEAEARKNGGLHKPLDGEGRRDLKFFLSEASQSVLSRCKDLDIHKCAWRMLNRGVPWNKVACAVAGKLSTYAWHVMRGDPTPNRETEAMYQRKLVEFFSTVGKKEMKGLGVVCTYKDYAKQIADKFYAHLPEIKETVNA